jgi:1-phosphatidylinositol phosphodiesterase
MRSHTSWMSDISDDTPVTALSIPGTHNSGCIGGVFGFAQTQNLNINDQLDAGIRFLDIRLAQCQDNLCIHHDAMCMNTTYIDILNTCSEFLEKYPSETILMSVKDESRPEDGSNGFAPLEVLRKLSTSYTKDADRNAIHFENILRARTWESLENYQLFYNFPGRPSLGKSPTNPAFTSGTILGEARGKIVLLRRFEGSQDVGVDLTYWPENQTFRSATPPIHDVHDRYQGLTEDDKYELIVAHLKEAKKGNLEDLYITFSSAVDLKADGYANMINPQLNNYLAGSPKGRVGIIVMDYFEEPPELVSNVIKMNPSRWNPTNRVS